MTYPDKVKFLLDYVIFFGSLKQESQSYHYELSSDESMFSNYKDETVTLIMFGDGMATFNINATMFTELQMEAIDLFYDNVISRIGNSQMIPEELSNLVHDATLEAQKEWDGAIVIRKKNQDDGRSFTLRQISVTGSCHLVVSDEDGSHSYVIRFCAGEFYDVTEKQL